MWELVGFWVFIVICFAMFCIGVVLAIVAWSELKSEDTVIISNSVDRECVSRYLSLSRKDRDVIDDEIKVRVDD